MKQLAARAAHQGEPATRLMTFDRLAQVYAISRTTAYGLLAEGKIQAVKLGRRRLIEVASVESFIASLERPHAGRGR